MTVIEKLKWLNTYKAIALCYATTAADLSTHANGIEIADGSLAYTGAGDVYVFNGTQWNKIGA